MNTDLAYSLIEFGMIWGLILVATLCASLIETSLRKS